MPASYVSPPTPPLQEFMDESLQLLGEAMGLSEATLLAGAGSLARTASNATPRPKVGGAWVGRGAALR